MSFFVPKAGDTLEADIAAFPQGIVVPVDKPYRWTSADVIRKLKWRAIKFFGKKNLKVGHAGTLDPLATGVLLVCIGDACKKAQELQDHDKEYIAHIRFGATTPSYDLEKDVEQLYPYSHITADAVRAILPKFLGEQQQVAPLFSAKSVDGVRAYEIARKLYRSGRAGKLDSAALENLHRSKITIHELELLDFADVGAPHIPADTPDTFDSSASSRIHVADTSALGLPEAAIRIVCSKGTYIRSFARDLGEALESGAHLSALIRSRSGDFPVSSALSLASALSLFPSRER